MTEEPANAAERESDGYAQAYPVIAKLRAAVYRLESVNADLLAALKAMVAEHDVLFFTKATRDEARAAIAKAEGTESNQGKGA